MKMTVMETEQDLNALAERRHARQIGARICAIGKSVSTHGSGAKAPITIREK
ncbi:hypothetical protein [Rhizobium sp. No.120]